MADGTGPVEVNITCPHCDVVITVPDGLKIRPGVCPRFDAQRMREAVDPP